jgi:hypothetical protein
VAARALPGTDARPAGIRAPWDLGYLQWSQLPEAWQEVIDTLPIGATSPVIDGPRGRAWVLRLVDRRIDPSVTFDAARPVIEQRLTAAAAERAQAELARQLRAGAHIELAPAPPAP